VAAQMVAEKVVRIDRAEEILKGFSEDFMQERNQPPAQD